jgi:hypothetical protein
MRAPSAPGTRRTRRAILVLRSAGFRCGVWVLWEITAAVSTRPVHDAERGRGRRSKQSAGES